MSSSACGKPGVFGLCTGEVRDGRVKSCRKHPRVKLATIGRSWAVTKGLLH